DAEWARVSTTTNTFLCRAVIVTCPPHLAAKIHYQPALSSQPCPASPVQPALSSQPCPASENSLPRTCRWAT
ncbi:hypothetical protein KUCAC02_009343, partial [Chaenocephalus aceratus]